MEVRKPKIKSMKYEDFTDNEYLEKMIEELRANGTNVVMGCLDEVINWAAATASGRLRSPRAAAVSNLWRSVPHATILPASGLK